MSEYEMSIMEMIGNAGECRCHVYAALEKANNGSYDEATKEMELAAEALGEAHRVQTSYLSREADGERIEPTILFVHAQDHLMTAISERNLIEQLIELRKLVNSLIDEKKG